MLNQLTGHSSAAAATDLWSTGEPLLHKLYMWFIIKGRLWTADRLQRTGLEHPAKCTLCCQKPETAEHIGYIVHLPGRFGTLSC
jgi:hypothetical protein